ncbi:hypothetical protein KIN20_035347 [Parelaphostrongylus tenuis]|uniref:26S proteasome non-ATPase regulatory subunit 1/RPN2 N-terminal domain-containing protein n=1 Tax=Parelaphostrongylus tenuis TaxID=148309 RepID=A0AAD5RBH9_PARTN|nr:hypothetical protein KIN20_035347 [Parelaphostrongylus tenuis]
MEERYDAQRIPRARRTHWATLARDREKWKSCWSQTVPALSRELSEDKTFPARQKAALLASKVAFCLEDYENALNFALAADTHFKLTPRPKSKTVGEKDDEANGEKTDARLEGLINRIFQRNLEKNELLYVIGLALDTRRIDMVEKAIQRSTESHVLLLETIQKVTSAKVDVQLRAQLLDVLVRLFTSNKHADFVAICQCLIKLNRPEEIGRILDRLMSHGNGDLIAYQIAFDLYENASAAVQHPSVGHICQSSSAISKHANIQGKKACYRGRLLRKKKLHRSQKSLLQCLGSRQFCAEKRQ